MRENGLEGERMVFNRENNPIHPKTEGCSNSISKIRIIFPADGDANTNEFIIGKTSQIFQAPDRFLETSGCSGKVIVQRGMRSPQFNLKETAPCSEYLIQKLCFGESSAVGEELDSPVAALFCCIDDQLLAECIAAFSHRA